MQVALDWFWDVGKEYLYVITKNLKFFILMEFHNCRLIPNLTFTFFSINENDFFYIWQLQLFLWHVNYALNTFSNCNQGIC